MSLTLAGWHDPESLRRNNLDFLRFVLATVVIFAHSFALPVGSDVTEPVYRFSRGQLSSGGVAVDAFFVISGLLITHSWLRSDRATSFFRKRVLRIYPAFIAATLIGALVVAPLASPPGTPWVSRAIAAKLLIATTTLGIYRSATAFATLPIAAINGSVWTIRYEFLCYVGVAICGTLGLLKNLKRLVPLFVLVVIGGLVIFQVWFRLTGRPPSDRVISAAVWCRLGSYYLAGMCFYLCRDRVPYSAPLALASLLLVVAACRVPPAVAIVFPTAGTYLLFYVAFHPRLRLPHFAKHGDFSYGIYLYAFPIQQLLVLHLGTSVPPLLLFLYSFPPSLLAGVASWYLVERWFIRLKRPQFPAPVVAQAAA